MTLAKIIDTLKMIALKHPNINSAYEGNIYDILNANPENKYASVVLTQQSHTTDETYDHYGFVIFYVDRLIDDLEENRVQIQSIGKSMLCSIITAFCDEFEAECDNISYQPFTQKFADETAGVYCTITIDTVKDVYCAERYWDESWTTPIVSIKNVDMSITLTENGHYTLDYDPTIYTGIGKVDIDVELNTEPYYNNGYENGYNNGVSEQKSKLETISITENGVYSNEDGYNHIEVNVPDLNGSYDEGYNQGYTEGKQVSYDEGYEQGQADVAANARVLDVTENGNYLSKFSDTIYPTLVTGVYDDGTEFYNYAQLTDKIFNTNITPTPTTRLELWYKGDNIKVADAWNNIISAGDSAADAHNYQVRYNGISNTRISIGIGDSNLTYDWDENAWHHILIAKETEDASYMSMWVDDVKVGDFSKRLYYPSSTFYINGIESNLVRNANGTFGMIKIDDVVIIPTADGFLNTNTGELLEVVKDGIYVFTDNPPKYGEGELYKTINVNVQPKINVAEIGLKFGNSTFETISDNFDFEGITALDYFFHSCKNLKTVPLFDTSKVSVMSYAFYGCSSLNTIPLFDTSKVTNMQYMFNGCTNLQTIPDIDTSNVTNMTYMFYIYAGNKNLISLPKFECGKVGNMNRYFAYSADGMSSLTDVGGWENLKIDWNDNYGLRACPNLTYQSCINILNGLYDFVGNGKHKKNT